MSVSAVQPDNRKGIGPAINRLVPGIIVCVLLAVLAQGVAALTGAPAMLLVILLGMAARFITVRYSALSSGINYSAREILRLGVALLGLRVVAQDIISLGWEAGLLVVASLAATVAAGFGIMRVLRQPGDTSAIAATSVAVCGASAALAASSVVAPREHLERDTGAIIITVSVLSTLVMLVYPLVTALIGFGQVQTSLMLGGAIHDVAQVVGAGFSISPEVGVQAMTVKLVRVACLLPVIVFWGWFFRRGCAAAEGHPPKLPVPLFLITFFVLALVVSFQLIPQSIAEFGGNLAGWMLLASVAAIGLKTSIAELRSTSKSLILAIVIQSAVQLGFVIALIFLLFGRA